MIDLVVDTLARVPEYDPILLLQATQPLRRVEHVQRALAWLRETGADSVVSVIEVPRIYHQDWQATIVECKGGPLLVHRWASPQVAWLRQGLRPTWIRDGTVYAFWRKTVTEHGTIYGQDVRPLIITPEETCALDTMADWQEAERRLRERG